jgi:D-alanyl-D-alanine carboxypeptidase
VRPPQIALRRRFVAFVALLLAVVAGFLLWPAQDAAPVRTPPLDGASSISRYTGPDNFLAWVPGGFDDPAFREKMERLAGLDEVVVVAGDTLWLRRTEDGDGRVVDEPASPFAFPIDAFAVQASDYAPFVGPGVRDEIVRALRAGRAVLGEHSARLRGLGLGGKLVFRTGSVRVGAVVPDDAVGWSEVLLSREVGRQLGIRHERYLLAQPSERLTRRVWKRKLLPFVGDDPLRVDVAGSTRYVRVASGVRPAIFLKQRFGEFAATPQADPAYLTIDPAWVERNIVTTEVPLLGTVTCHRKLVPMVRGALYEIAASSLASEIKVYSGCWASRTVSRSPTAPPSYHAYGAAIDINAPQNPYGSKPTMNREIVRIFERWGFNWGGDFLIPDGHHFEFWKVPDQLRNT